MQFLQILPPLLQWVVHRVFSLWSPCLIYSMLLHIWQKEPLLRLRLCYWIKIQHHKIKKKKGKQRYHSPHLIPFPPAMTYYVNPAKHSTTWANIAFVLWSRIMYIDMIRRTRLPSLPAVSHHTTKQRTKTLSKNSSVKLFTPSPNAIRLVFTWEWKWQLEEGQSWTPYLLRSKQSKHFLNVYR